MQLTIGIDFTSASRQRAGIGRYARELVRGLARLDHANRYLLFVPRDAYSDLIDLDFPPNFTIHRAPLTERALAALWQRARIPLPIELFLGRVDIFYSPDFVLAPTRARRTVLTIHDLSYLRVPECFPPALKSYLDRAVPRSLRRADLVLADAKSTRNDLIELYGVSPERVQVLYSGVDKRFSPNIPMNEQERVRNKYDLHSRYLLSVSTIQPRKNYVRLIQAFSNMKPRSGAEILEDSAFSSGTRSPVGWNLKLLISGSQGWMYEEVYATVEKLGLQDRVLLPGFAAEQDLPALYAMATLFVYPSLYEGFGLPVAEAMASGVPVVCSNASSLPEVAGQAALYFDPLDVRAMQDAIERALQDDSLRTELRQKGLAQAQQFSWDRAAQELVLALTNGG